MAAASQHTMGMNLRRMRSNQHPVQADLCFVTSVPIADVVAHLAACGVEIIEGPVCRTGAVSELKSVYLRDPDGNLIEVANRVG